MSITVPLSCEMCMWCRGSGPSCCTRSPAFVDDKTVPCVSGAGISGPSRFACQRHVILKSQSETLDAFDLYIFADICGAGAVVVPAAPAVGVFRHLPCGQHGRRGALPLVRRLRPPHPHHQHQQRCTTFQHMGRVNLRKFSESGIPVPGSFDHRILSISICKCGGSSQNVLLPECFRSSKCHLWCNDVDHHILTFHISKGAD